MAKKEQLEEEIKKLPGDLVEEVYDFVTFVRQRREKEEEIRFLWSDLALNSGAFDFWNDPKEVEYSREDLREKA